MSVEYMSFKKGKEKNVGTLLNSVSLFKHLTVFRGDHRFAMSDIVEANEEDTDEEEVEDDEELLGLNKARVFICESIRPCISY